MALDPHPVRPGYRVVHGLLFTLADPASPDSPGVQAIRELSPPVQVQPAHYRSALRNFTRRKNRRGPSYAHPNIATEVAPATIAPNIVRPNALFIGTSLL